jgi:hypothetical protein
MLTKCSSSGGRSPSFVGGAIPHVLPFRESQMPAPWHISVRAGVDLTIMTPA